MSIEIDWLSLTPMIADQLTDKLNRLLDATARPDFLGPIDIQSITFGDIPPEVEILDIRDVCRGFRMADGKSEHSSCASVDSHSPSTRPVKTADTQSHDGRSQPSLEIHLRLTYDGNIRIRFATSLILNYPSPGFMSLPINASVVGISFDAHVILAIEADRSKLHLTLLEPPPSDSPLYDESQENTPHKRSSVGARILPHLFVETEVGNADRHVLRNVGKVERFLTEMVRNLICDELLYPTFQTFEWD